MMALYQHNEMLATIAQELIADHYPDIAKYEIKIAYMFRAEIPRVAGVCRKIDDQNRALHGFDFAITLARDVWDRAEKDQSGKIFQRAVLDHELQHVAIVFDEETGDPKYDKESGLIKTRLVEHDVQEFAAILKRYGPYADDLRAFIEAHETWKRQTVKTTIPEATSGTD